MDEATPCIRPLGANDIEAVCALSRTVWQATYPTLISQAQIDAMLADRYNAARIQSQLNDPQQAWWGAEVNQTLIGFAHALCENDGIKLDKLYVHPAWQRRGIGRALLQAVQDWTAQQQIPRIWLQVNRGNTQAISAYQQYGFHMVESRVFDIGNGFVMDDHIMERSR